ncbi:MAG: hypothetical protein JO296_09780 [Pseudonocardiales bacterium]|jgi:hypothetical protein|nr:hypothetical protein [Pseudonocardiales bacterium]
MPGQADVKPTIVLLHGAFADVSSWNGVIKRPQQQDYTVIAPVKPTARPGCGAAVARRGALSLLKVSA